MIAPAFNNVPSYLTQRDRWLLWRTEQRVNRKTGEVSATKPPISFHTGKHCDVTNPRSWTSFGDVTAALGKSRAWDGAGFALGEIEESDEIAVGLDLDTCLDEDGALAEWAMPFLVAMASYAEQSPSGVGIKCIARIRLDDLPTARKLLGITELDKEQARTRTFGKRPPGGHAPGAQLFLGKRYFTVTGTHWVASPEDVTLLSLGQLAQLGVLFGPNERHGAAPQRGANAVPADDDETELDEAALRDKLGAAFLRNPRLRERWEGGTQGLNDTTRSGRDMSVLALLVAENFTKGEVRGALRLFEHGKFKEEAPRYFEQMWSRTKATPHVDPEPSPEWEEQHPAASSVPDGYPTPSRPGLQLPSSWPEPVDCFAPLNTDPVEITEEEAPPALWPFVRDTAERMGVAISSVTLGTIVTCSAVITDDWRLQPKRHDYTWTENARLWGAIVGPPSVLKTPILAACTRPIDHLERDARKQWREDMRRHAREHAAWRKAKAADQDHNDPEPQPPKCPRWLVESATVEALQEVLRDDDDGRFTAPAKKVLVRQDELSEFLANLDRYSAGRPGGDRGAYLRLYNGGPFSVDRIGRGAFTASNWSGCLLGGIQPEPIQRIAKQTVDDGLLQRMTYDVPPPPTKEGTDRKPDRQALERYHRLIPALATLRPAALPDRTVQAVVLHADAHRFRESIDELARNMAAMPDLSSRLQSAFGKWPGLFARLCLTFHLIEIANARVQGNIGPSPDVVSAETAERVSRYMRRVLLRHLLRAEAVMFATVQTGHAQWIAGHILAHRLDRITTRDVIRAYLALRPPECRDELQSVMASLVSIGWLDPEPPRNSLNPVSAWLVNPLAHDRFAWRTEQERLTRKRRADETIKRRQANAADTR